MGFDSGTMSFARYAVIGQSPASISQTEIDQLKEQAFTNDGIPAEVEYGWVGPRHVFDDGFAFDTCVFNDCLHFALRVDTNKVPPEVKRAYIAIKEKHYAAQNPSGFISKVQKRMAREEVAIQIEADMRQGKYRRSKSYPILWDLTTATLYAPAATSVKEKLCEIFQRTFGLELQILTSGHVAERHCEGAGFSRDYEQWSPTRFARSSNDPDMPATYPWAVRGDGAKDYLGNEFLMWLWYISATNDGMVNIYSGPRYAVMFNRSLAMDCCFAESGKTGLTSFGPTRMPEAMDAARSGKVPRKASLVIDHAGDQFSFTIGGESLAISSLKLPDVEDADTLRVLFEERINLLRQFDQTMKDLFGSFLRLRLDEWDSTTKAISRWMTKETVKPSIAREAVGT